MRNYEELRDRRAVLCVPADTVLSLLLGWREDDSVVLPRLSGVPGDAILKSVHYDANRDGFCLVLLHESFDAVAKGCAPPEITLEMERVRIGEQRTAGGG